MTDTARDRPLNPDASGFGLPYFALGLIAVGVLNLVSGDFAQQWQPVPAWVPGHAALVRVSGLVLLACGGALLSKRGTLMASRVLFGYLLLWMVLLRVPSVLRAPLVEVNWESLGEVAVLTAAGWVLYAKLGGDPGAWSRVVPSGERRVRLARWLFGAALLPIGLSHFFYIKQTISLVPAWMPGRAGWAYFCGAGHIAAGLGVLAATLPRLAATLEAVMITGFTLLVWLPALFAAPTDPARLAETLDSWIIGAGAWVVADSYRGAPWIARRF
ncbi:MAG TPA: hypothetical protein VJN39_05470 [Gemmatimonadales bacterium]|nr:hypothetical protein [Gemmatimonadales bacterium]